MLIKDLIETIIKHVPNKKLSIKWDTSKPTGDKIRVMDMTRANKNGFRCSVSLEEGLKKTINWFLDNKDYSSSKYNSFNEK